MGSAKDTRCWLRRPEATDSGFLDWSLCACGAQVQNAEKRLLRAPAVAPGNFTRGRYKNRGSTAQQVRKTDDINEKDQLKQLKSRRIKEHIRAMSSASGFRAVFRLAAPRLCGSWHLLAFWHFGFLGFFLASGPALCGFLALVWLCWLLGFLSPRAVLLCLLLASELAFWLLGLYCASAPAIVFSNLFGFTLALPLVVPLEL